MNTLDLPSFLMILISRAVNTFNDLMAEFHVAADIGNKDPRTHLLIAFFLLGVEMLYVVGPDLYFKTTYPISHSLAMSTTCLNDILY